ncbi:MAG: radical SAM protein [bacterium]|nr:radical SAM protein [bacterium]
MNRPLERQFRSLRVSLTARCDLACHYCVDPNAAPVKGSELKSAELAQLVRLLDHALGLQKIKLTGGEPLLGQKTEDFLDALGPLPGPEISLTTNGQRLAGKVEALRQRGLSRINVSLDSLDAQRFADCTRGGKLDATLAGIEAAQAAGFSVKLNMVPQRGRNEQDCLPLLEFALARGLELRYIELMPMGHLRGPSFDAQFWGMQDILAQLRCRFELVESHRPWSSTALEFMVPERGRFGVIANHSRPFCHDCDRLRLSAQGELVGCLSSGQAFNLRPLLGLNEDQALARLRPLLAEALATKQELSFVGSALGMKLIGG